MNTSAVNYYPFCIGELPCASVSAGSGQFRVAAFFADVLPDALQPVLERYDIHTEKIATPFNCLLIRHAAGLTLIDTGVQAAPLIASLQTVGLAPEDIRTVILSHTHGDHMGGTFSTPNHATFPNARYLLSRVEWDTVSKRVRSELKRLSPELIEADAEILDGVSAVPAPGHTAGQVAIKVTSGGATLLYTADVIAHPIHLEHPEWNIISDADRAEALRTRARLLGEAADNGWQLFVYHFPFPGMCRIRRDGARWQSAQPS